MADTKYCDTVDESVAPMESVSFVSDFRRAKISPIIYFCSIGTSCITVKKKKNSKQFQQQKPEAINQLRRIWLMYCKIGLCWMVRAFKFCKHLKKPCKRSDTCAAQAPNPDNTTSILPAASIMGCCNCAFLPHPQRPL